MIFTTLNSSILLYSWVDYSQLNCVGVPDKISVQVIKTEEDNTVKLSFNVTDTSAAPATGLIVFLKVWDSACYSQL